VARSSCYAISQRKRKRVEEIFGRQKATDGLGKLMVRGLAKVLAVFMFTRDTYNIICLPKLLATAGEVRLASCNRKESPLRPHLVRPILTVRLHETMRKAQIAAVH
jgi:hypothetical protein